jgi:hypothetical protein
LEAEAAVPLAAPCGADQLPLPELQPIQWRQQAASVKIFALQFPNISRAGQAYGPSLHEAFLLSETRWVHKITGFA